MGRTSNKLIYVALSLIIKKHRQVSFEFIMEGEYMKNTFKITTVDGKTYMKESPQKVLDIEDGRQVKREYGSDSACKIITHDIHYC